METEEFISGFCRTCNGSQTVCCEYREKDGRRFSHLWTVHIKDVYITVPGEIYKEAHRLK